MSARPLSSRQLLGLAATLFMAVTLASPFITRGEGSSPAFWQLLLPRALMAALAGMVLSGSGAVLQGVLRNELASPFTLGVASGATLGAALVVRFGWEGAALLGIPTLSPLVFASLVGALASTSAILVLARSRRLNAETLVLAGVGMSLLVNAAVMALFLIDAAPRYTRMLFWTMGDLAQIGYEKLIWCSPLVIAGFAALAPVVSRLDRASLDDDSAAALGVDVSRVRLRALLGTGLLTAGIVAFCGPIGFVGLIIPHAARLLGGPRHLTLVPAAMLLGGAFLGGCDVLARTLAWPQELPIGVVTSLVGAPAFIAMLIRQRMSG